MTTDILVFDIETIPQGVLTPTQIKIVNEKSEKSEYWQTNPIKEMSLNPWFGRIISIGVGFPLRNQYECLTLEDEHELLTKFWGILSKWDGMFLSYNGLGFDVPFISTRSMVHKILPTSSHFLNTKRYQSYPHFDVAQHICDWDPRLRVSLEVVCDGLGISSPKEGDVKASSVYENYLVGNLDDISKYCVKDLVATYEVYKRIKDYR